MGLFSFLKKYKRSGLANPAQWLIDWIHGDTNSSGITTSENTALKFPPIWAAVNIIAGAVGTLPLEVYRRLDKGKERAQTNPLYWLLHDRANDYMDALTFRETLQGHVLTWGNGYAEIQRDKANRPVALWPLRPDKTEPRLRADGTLIYEYRNYDNSVTQLPSDNVLHIRGLGFDGYKGYSPIRYMMESIGLGRAAEKFGALFFGQGSKLAGLLEHPGKLSEEAAKKLRTSFEALHGGLENAHRVAILEEGIKWTQIGIPPEEAQFLETRKFQIADIARIYQVPLHMLGDLERATFSNIEHQGIEFVTHTLMRWLKRWEHEVNYKLFGYSNNINFAEFNVDGFLRGDIQSRYAAYAVGRNWGWLSANEVREKENMNPVDGGDIYLSPLNMIKAEDVGKPPPAAPTIDEIPSDDKPKLPDDTSDEKAKQKQDSARARAVSAHRELIRGLCERIAYKEFNAVKKLARHPAQFNEAVGKFYDTHGQHIQDVLEPALAALAAALPENEGRTKLTHGFLAQKAADYISARRNQITNPDGLLIYLDTDAALELADTLLLELAHANAQTNQR